VSEAAPVAIAEVDGAGRMLYVNRRWLELTGAEAGSTHPWSDLVHDDDRPRVTRLQLDGGGAPEEMRIVRGDAAVWVIAQMARLGGESADRYIVALADITAQKKAIGRAEQLSRELMTVSRKAGMAEISAGVLHNVGNVLSSVLVSATTLGELLHQSRVSGLVKATSLLEERRDDLAAFLATDRGKLVVPYLIQVADHLAGDVEDAQSDLARIVKGIEHIRVIIASQQTYAKAASLTEELRVSEVLDEVLGLNASRFDKHEVRIVRRFEADPALVTDRHRIMQILINLIGNALQAVNEVYPAASPDARSTLTITMRMTPAGNLAIEVADNGVGIAPDNLGRIFEFGFTTRKEGHGFGLHSSALTARDLGGSLRVESEGLGRGATFTLELPVPAVRQVERSA
jgi:PAS domain S-box-containing protein